jgi:hypothetical protein
MPRKHEIGIYISREGSVTVNVEGLKGSSCLDLTKDLEESLGAVIEREKKPGFYESAGKENAAESLTIGKEKK